MPVITVATGIANEKLKEKFGSCTRKTLNRFTTKAALFGTSHIVRKVLQAETCLLVLEEKSCEMGHDDDDDDDK